MLDGLLAALYPGACCGCGRLGPALCEHCAPSGRAVRRLRFGDLSVVAAGPYAGPLRVTILAYKRGRRDAGDALAALLAPAVAARLPPGTLLVPVPTAGPRRRERGFDQGVRLAERCAAATGRDVRPVLTLRAHDSQRGRSRRARLSARGRFTCDVPAAIAGRAVALVDDVVTTGTTLADCAAVLAANGARVVLAFVLAYA